MEPYKSLKLSLTKYNQDHLLRFWDELNEKQQEQLSENIRDIDLDEVTRYFKIATESDIVNKVDDRIQPISEEQYHSFSQTGEEVLKGYWARGLREISQGHVGVLLMAGGQGTRLGVSYPKGMYDIGLLSHKTLFQIQAERIIKLQNLAFELTGKSGIIRWYIMTSGPTYTETRKYFETNNYFGLSTENVILFEQGLLPCFDFEGKIILDNKFTISQAPDGNGGIYKALKQNKILDDMSLNGVKYLHAHSVDNILIKVADPYFVGYCVEKGADCAAKVVEKTDPTEAVGVICQLDNVIQVVEYSEITPKTAELRAPDGSLKFKAGNICNHFFTREFLEIITNRDLKLHVAKKKIPFVDEMGNRVTPKATNGIKIEKFVFDVFEFSQKFLVWEVPRDEDFSPLKNATGSCSPETSRLDLFNAHKKYLKRAGALVLGDQFEISPVISYNGEGLEKYSKQELISPVLLK